MTCWIAIDENTALALRDRGIEATPSTGDPMEEALASATSVLVLPAGENETVVARIQHGAQPSSDFSVHRWADERAVGYQAGGMLGLLDEPVYEEEQAPPKKKWWQRKRE